MTKLNLSLRLRGDLPTLGEINEKLGIQASNFYKKGELVGRSKKRVQSYDVWILDLTPNLSHESSTADLESELLNAVVSLDAILPQLDNFKSTNFDSEIYISFIQEGDQGGFRLPYQLIQSAATVNIPITVSTIAI